jgi:two-component system cell cycle sensor histidine kinase/response regulator CckA
MDTIHPLKLLIIEDNPVDREIYKRSLWQSNTHHFDFAEADSAILGIEKAKNWRPDCALVDVNLPDMDGIEALSRLCDKAGRIPFAAVVLTAQSAEPVAVRAMHAGAMDYLPKGQVTADALRRTVLNAIDRFQMQQRIEEQRSALEQSAQRYQVLLEAMPQMVWTADADGHVEYANRQWFEYTGLTLSERAGLGWDHLVHPEDRERTWRAWNEAAKSGAVFEIEHRLRRAADASYRWHLVRAVPMRGNDRQIAHWFGTCTEIESQKQSEKAVLEKQKLESLGRLAGGLAHDFNNLLVTILCGACYAMEGLPATHPAQDILQGVIQAGERAAEITRQMLAYAGKANLCVRRADLAKLVQEAISGASIPKTISVEVQGAEQLPFVETDSEQLRQVIVDLMRNAVEAIEEGASGTISVRTTSVELGEESARGDFGSSTITPGKYVALEIGDTGCGMDEETQKKIFDPFFSTKFTGRGLGLAAVRGFVRSNGGGVQVDSTPGKGARFRVLLPAALEDSAA